MIIGVTGKICSGKTTLCNNLVKYLRELGYSATHIDADKIRWELYQNVEIMTRLKSIFSSHDLQTQENQIKRKIISDIIFNNDELRREFEKLIHPVLRDSILKEIKECRSEWVFVEWALLLQNQDFLWDCGPVLILDTPDDTRKRWLIDQNDLSWDELKKRDDLQWNPDQQINHLKRHDIPYAAVSMANALTIKDLRKILVRLQMSFRGQADQNSPCLFQIPKSGKRVLWQITNRCNYSCSYCVFQSNSTKDPQELSYDEILSTMDQLKQSGYTHIKFTGGEPFSRADLLDILKQATQKGFYFDLSTNGTYITPNMAGILSAFNFEKIHFSLDGPDAFSHETVRGKNTFQPTLRGIQSLSVYPIPIRIGCVLHKDNENKISEMMQFCESLGVDELVFSYMEPRGKVTSASPVLPTRDIARIMADIHSVPTRSLKVDFNNKQEQHGHSGLCPGSDRFLYLNHLGQVAPCSWIIDTDKSLLTEKTLRHHSLSELLTDKNIQNFRLSIDHANVRGCPYLNGENSSR